MPKTTRLQVDILEHQLEELEELRKLGGLRSKRELWDTAFTLLKWVTRKKALGLSIGSMDKECRFTELDMPFLDHYAARVRKEQLTIEPKEEVAIPKERRVRATVLGARSSNGKISLAKKRQLA
jgi:hypothetical protein